MWHYLRDWMNIVSSLVLFSIPRPKSSNLTVSQFNFCKTLSCRERIHQFLYFRYLGSFLMKIHRFWLSLAILTLLKYSKVMHPKILKYNLLLTLLLIIRFKVKMKGMRNTLPGLDWYPCCQTEKRNAILHFITWSAAQAKMLKRLKCLSRLWSAKY